MLGRATTRHAIQSDEATKQHGRRQTDRTKSQEELYRAEYQRWYQREMRRLDSEASERRASYDKSLKLPLASSSESGEFSDYEMLSLGFSSELHSKVPERLLMPSVSWEKLNNSARQRFSVELRKVEAYSGGVDDARMPGEREPADFAFNHARYLRNIAFRQAVDAKLAFWKQQLLQRHQSLVRVKSLPDHASLMESMQAVTAARGRPLTGDGPRDAKWMHEKKQLYSGGQFTNLEEMTDFGNRKVDTSHKDVRTNVFQGASQLFEDVPTDPEASKGRKQNAKVFNYQAESTSRGHYQDMAEWRIEQALAALGPNRALFWDEGTRKDGTAFIAVGDYGILPDGEVNRRFSGTVIPLTGKDGRTVAAAILAVCKRNGIERSYFPLSDSVSSTVGHKSGAVAYLRQEWKVRVWEAK